MIMRMVLIVAVALAFSFLAGQANFNFWNESNALSDSKSNNVKLPELENTSDTQSTTSSNVIRISSSQFDPTCKFIKELSINEKLIAAACSSSNYYSNFNSSKGIISPIDATPKAYAIEGQALIPQVFSNNLTNTSHEFVPIKSIQSPVSSPNFKSTKLNVLMTSAFPPKPPKATPPPLRFSM
mmetsp:Transcript_8820/g.12212  ORF Transcript_8820/g.12212 Transcript_8820/m.12212 type:complete len:183 (+) Transcript_8820:707-1255(+)|eukprot:CAMPEP_0170076472 /NCGR_PEP_ID=MMETSP0019_2-20121128/13465_1 /TAXON_ID=98059 /ORGANISM="Dinobryon sp., Strain UTEXLB2267" /LENGTH=182 /DNA_ID=CAMNT_0010288187 /DNA_START=166 /DNA_END=714 /DNA_ORIENTATION=-